MKKLLGAALLCSALTGCAGLNSDFDCNKKSSGSLVTPLDTSSHAAPVPVNTAGRVPVQRIPDATQRLWIAPWVDTDDNFHQPAVVEFVKNKSHWDESYRVIGEGGE
ncbi:MAG: TraV family lipoprotein [Enterobacter roggenkampii]|nr:TraV family lipoprotein [Enterobacter roggenkampii]